MRRLVRNGQIEFVNGGMSSTDEACPTYDLMINNLFEARRFIALEFGEDTADNMLKTGWQLDPFGHSKTYAKLISEIGYESLFFAREDQVDKNNRTLHRQLEFMWQASDYTLPIYTHIFKHHYSSPNAFDPVHNRPGPLVGDMSSPIYNGRQVMEGFVKYLESYVMAYNSNNILVIFGDDFGWENAQFGYWNIDVMIEEFRRANASNFKFSKQEHTFELKYSTPNRFVRAVKAEHQGVNMLEWFRGDFFPYIDESNLQWTGYFSSRPNFKRMVRQLTEHYYAAS